MEGHVPETGNLYSLCPLKGANSLSLRGNGNLSYTPWDMKACPSRLQMALFRPTQIHDLYFLFHPNNLPAPLQITTQMTFTLYPSCLHIYTLHQLPHAAASSITTPLPMARNAQCQPALPTHQNYSSCTILTLEKEAQHSSEMSVTVYQTTCCSTTEDLNLLLACS
jgi:hypothetical protein